MDDHVAVFSDVPTSPYCTIFVVNIIDDFSIEVNMICKGKNVWTQHLLPESTLLYPLGVILTAATFNRKSQTLCFFDSGNFVHLFSVKNKKWEMCLVGDKKWTPVLNVDIPISPCDSKKYMFSIKIKEKRDQFDLEDDEDVYVCGYSRLIYVPEPAGFSDYPTELMNRRNWF